MKSICEEGKKQEDFGNGRFCRNLVENAVLSYALRVYGEESYAERKRFTLSAQDFFVPKNENETKQKIGF